MGATAYSCGIVVSRYYRPGGFAATPLPGRGRRQGLQSHYVTVSFSPCCVYQGAFQVDILGTAHSTVVIGVHHLT
jgi:hypothetical protein